MAISSNSGSNGDRSFLAACGEGIAGLSVAWSHDLGYARVDPEVADLCAAALQQQLG